jgi:Chorismate mutase type II
MSRVTSGQAINGEKQDLVSSADLPKTANSNLTKFAAWTSDRNIPFLITSIGMIVMLLWAGSYKMTAPGAEGIVPLVPHEVYELFGPVPFQGCHISRGVLLPDQLFRPTSYPFRDAPSWNRRSKVKWNTGSAIEDPEREQKILQDVGAKAKQANLPPQWVQHFFRLQIEAAKT